jgi:hypothetical protein
LGVGFTYVNKNVGTMDVKLSQELEKAKKLFPSIPDMRSLSGIIVSISDNVITIKTPDPSNPFEELPTMRDVVVTPDTKIVKQAQENQAQFQKEFQDFQKKVQAAGANAGLRPITSQLPSNETQLRLFDLKVNDRIAVEAKENIKTSTRFEATKITVQFAFAGTPAVAPPAVAPAAPIVAPGAAPLP